MMGNIMTEHSPLLLDAFTDLDCVLLDKEHGVFGTEELIPMTMRCRALELPSIVRVEDSAYHLIAKAIDLGADGIMLPRVESLEQIKTAVDAMHFPPIGRTGFGGWGIFRAGETMDDFQKGRILLPQIESVKGRELIPQMVELYGDFIDGFIIGPNDYSISLGIPRETDNPILIEEIQKVFAVCNKLGKSCGCYAADSVHAQRYQKMGANVLWNGDDISYMRAGIRASFAYENEVTQA